MNFISLSPTSHYIDLSNNQPNPIIFTFSDLDQYYNKQHPLFIQLKNFISNQVNPQNNFKLVNQPNDKLFIIENQIIIEIKIIENLYIALIHFAHDYNSEFINKSLHYLNKLLVHELTNLYNERLLKFFDKKVILFSNINHSFSHFYKNGPFQPHSLTIFNFPLPTSTTPWFEYTIKLNQFIYNNLSKEIQQQKHQEKKAMIELGQQSHSHAKSKIKINSYKRQKTSDMEV